MTVSQAVGHLGIPPLAMKNFSALGFPGGTVVKNLPANAGNTGSGPDAGRSHKPQSNEALVPQLLSPHA